MTRVFSCNFFVFPLCLDALFPRAYHTGWGQYLPLTRAAGEGCAGSVRARGVMLACVARA